MSRSAHYPQQVPDVERRWRPAAAVAGAVLVAAVVGGTALTRGADEDHAHELSVVWGGSEGHPPCVYDSAQQTVEAELRVSGTGHDDATVTVTAYADENTSRPVGSASRTVRADGTLHLTIRVDRPPHVDDDGVAACRLSLRP